MESPAATLISHLGVKPIAERLGVVENAVFNARKGGMPTRWYLDIREMCDKAGIPCPKEAFNWSRATPKAKRKPKPQEDINRRARDARAAS